MAIATYPLEMHSAVPDARRAALRAELEQTRADFHSLLARNGEQRWREPSLTCAWTVGELCVHMTWALELLPKEVDAARRGRGMFNMPKWLGEPLSYWYVRWLARTATPADIGARYDRAMDATLRLLDTIPPDDWARGAGFYGEGFHSVEDLFHAPTKHFSDHTTGL